MIKRADECSVKVNEAMRGGPGAVILTEIADKIDTLDKARLFSLLTLKQGCGIGYHEHHGECEIFYILNGEAIYNDDGREVEIHAGDVTIVEDGHGHSIRNDGEKDVNLIALIPLK